MENKAFVPLAAALALAALVGFIAGGLAYCFETATLPLETAEEPVYIEVLAYPANNLAWIISGWQVSATPITWETWQVLKDKPDCTLHPVVHAHTADYTPYLFIGRCSRPVSLVARPMDYSGSGVRLILYAAYPTRWVGYELHEDHWEAWNPVPGWRP
jgi:hypothetical protein